MGLSRSTSRLLASGASVPVPVKIVALVFVVVSAVIIAITWKSRSLLIDDRANLVVDSEMKQVAPLKRFVQERLGEEKAQLVRFAAGRIQYGVARARSFGDFEAIALVEPGASSQWTQSWIESSPAPEHNQQASEAAAGRAEMYATLLQSLPFAKVGDGEVAWARLSDRQGLPIYAALVSVEMQTSGLGSSAELAPPLGGLPDTPDETQTAPSGLGKKAVIVGFSSEAPLGAVTEDFIGSTSTVFIIDDRGYVVSHVNKAYLGALFSNHQLVHDVVTSHKSAESGRFEDLESRQVIGYYEKIDHSNLYAVVTTPADSVTAPVEAVIHSGILAGSMVGFFGLMLAWLVGKTLTTPVVYSGSSGHTMSLTSNAEDDDVNRFAVIETAASDAAQIPAAAPAPMASPPSLPPTNETTQAVAAIPQPPPFGSSKLSDGFLAAVSGPLNSILGHAQLAKAKENQGEAQNHVESIERDVRRMRELVGKISDWKDDTAGAAATEPAAAPIDIVDVVNAAVERLKPELQSEGIKVVTDLHSVSGVHCASDAAATMIRHLVENAREAMRGRAVKEIKITLGRKDASVCLSVADTGVGMSRDVQEQVFEPFFKRFESPERTGLGLTMVKSAIKKIGGDCSVESSPGEGATFTLRFPVVVEDDDDDQFASVPLASAGAAAEAPEEFRVQIRRPKLKG